MNLREWKADDVDHAGGVKQHFGLLCRRVLRPDFTVGLSEFVVNFEAAVGLGEVLVSDGCLEGAEEAWVGQEAPCGGEKASEIVYQVRLTEGISCVSVVVQDSLTVKLLCTLFQLADLENQGVVDAIPECKAQEWF